MEQSMYRVSQQAVAGKFESIYLTRDGKRLKFFHMTNLAMVKLYLHASDRTANLSTRVRMHGINGYYDAIADSVHQTKKTGWYYCLIVGLVQSHPSPTLSEVSIVIGVNVLRPV